VSRGGIVLRLCGQVPQRSSQLHTLILSPLPVTEVRVAKCLEGISTGIVQGSTNSSSEATAAVALQHLTPYPASIQYG